MKKLFVLLTVFCLFLSGCTKLNDSAKTTLPPETSVTDTIQTPEQDLQEVPEGNVEPVYSQQPMVAVSVPITTEYTTEDDNLIYYYTYQNIYLAIQDQQVADTIIVDFLNRLDRNHADSKDLAELAHSAYTGDEGWIPHFFESVYSPMRVDMSVMSLFGQNVIYTGGNHPQRECMTANYNMITGEVLTLGSILCNIDSIEPLCNKVIEKMELQKEESSLFDDYEDVIRQRFARDASYDEDWYFSQNGLCFYFAPYEIAPYISGVITVEIPYSDLTGIISDAFFPAEEDLSEGTVHATKLADADIDNFTQIAELPLNEDGELIFLYCDGLVRNLRVDVGEWNEDGTSFVVRSTVLATTTLSPGDGITIQAQIPDVMPPLRLSYRSGENEIVQYIGQSGEDGSIHLVEF